MVKARTQTQHQETIKGNRISKIPPFWCDFTNQPASAWALLSKDQKELAHTEALLYFDGCGTRRSPPNWAIETSTNHRLFGWKGLLQMSRIPRIRQQRCRNFGAKLPVMRLVIGTASPSRKK